MKTTALLTLPSSYNLLYADSAMFSFIIDIVGAYFAAKNVPKKPFLIIVSLLVGGFSAISANLLIFAVASDVFTGKEILTRIIFGLVVHPTITVVAALLFARRFKSQNSPSS